MSDQPDPSRRTLLQAAITVPLAALRASAANSAVRAAESTLTAIMATRAIDQKREITWKDLVA